MRGDFGRVELGAGANLQDNCVMHSYPGRIARVAENGHVGHAAVLHGCEVGRGALIGIGAVIMDNASIGEEALVAAMSFVKEGMQVPPRVLVAGIPARVMRELTAVELQWKARGVLQYQELARRSLQELRECEPLRAPEAGLVMLRARASHSGARFTSNGSADVGTGKAFQVPQLLSLIELLLAPLGPAPVVTRGQRGSGPPRGS